MSATMTSLPEYLEFLPQCKTLLCILTAACLADVDLPSHLEDKHNYSSDTSERISNAARIYDVALTRKDTCIPAHYSPPIDGLPVEQGW